MILQKLTRSFLSIFILISLAACRHRPRQISFYYWRTVFQLNELERKAIQNNGVTTLFIRYFDVDFNPADSIPKAISPIAFNTMPGNLRIVPVVYLRNRTFYRISIDSIPTLAKAVKGLVSAINKANKIQSSELQFDCDWTEKTKNKYFLFLRQVRLLSKDSISCTIRLHQVKYPAQMGIPPVDVGVLMFYNMGNIDTGTGNSVYEKSIAEKYSPSIKTYPLPLDLAIPIFSWSLQIRDGRVIQLLNKMSAIHFVNDSNFTPETEKRYNVNHACFRGGYYFRQGDHVKIEQVPSSDLFDIVAQVNKYSNRSVRNLIFYDLDQRNLVLYEKNIFRKVGDCID